MARVDTLGHFLTDVADAIREKSGTSETIQASSFDTAIANIPSGGGTVEVEEKDVNFYDYDGTLLHAYTLAEAQALNELPEAPEHEGLTFQEWNWDLADIKAENSQVNVGATYITDDGYTRIYVELTESTLEPVVSFGINGAGIIDWGDGQTTSVTGTTLATHKNFPHVYSLPGEYLIRIKPDEGSKIRLLGNNNIGSYLFWSNKSAMYYGYYPLIKKIEIGADVQTYDCCFYKFFNLKTVTIPNTIDLIGNRIFRACRKLKFIVIPKNYPVKQYFFEDCRNLEGCSLPKTGVSLGDNSFQYTYNLKKIVIPSSYTNLGYQPFRNSGCKKLILNFENLTSTSSFLSCNELLEVKFNNNLIIFKDSMLRECYTLSKVTLPAKLETMEANCLYGNYGLYILDCSNCEQIPEMLNANALGGLSNYIKIIVPDALYDNWIVANNWSTYASKIIKASEV